MAKAPHPCLSMTCGAYRRGRARGEHRDPDMITDDDQHVYVSLGPNNGVQSVTDTMVITDRGAG